MNMRVGATNAVAGSNKSEPSYMNHLRASNPHIDDVLKANPGVKTFLDRMDAVGAVAHDPAPGEVTTDHQWSLWSHSPQSAGLPPNWRDEVVVVMQSDPNAKHTVDFGPEKFQGKVIGVFTKGQIFTSETVVKDARGQEGGFSDDGGFESVMRLRTVGKPGEAVGVSFATGMMDAQGKASGWWGWPGEYDYQRKQFDMGGYAGRQYEATHGVADHFPIDDHGKKQVLVRVPNPPAGKAPFKYEAYKPPAAQGAQDGVDRSAARKAAADAVGNTLPNTTSGTGQPAGANGALMTAIRNMR